MRFTEVLELRTAFESVVPALLAAKIRVLVYAGEMDYICNYMGNKVCYLS